MRPLARPPELQAALESIHLRLEEWDIDPSELLLCLGDLLDVLTCPAEQLLLEPDEVGVDSAPVPDILRVDAISTLPLQQAVEIDQPFRKVGWFHRRHHKALFKAATVG
jgi:hypothetical protein